MRSPTHNLSLVLAINLLLGTERIWAGASQDLTTNLIIPSISWSGSSFSQFQSEEQDVQRESSGGGRSDPWKDFKVAQQDLSSSWQQGRTTGGTNSVKWDLRPDSSVTGGNEWSGNQPNSIDDQGLAKVGSKEAKNHGQQLSTWGGASSNLVDNPKTWGQYVKQEDGANLGQPSRGESGSSLVQFPNAEQISTPYSEAQSFYEGYNWGQLKPPIETSWNGASGYQAGGGDGSSQIDNFGLRPTSASNIVSQGQSNGHLQLATSSHSQPTTLQSPSQSSSSIMVTQAIPVASFTVTSTQTSVKAPVVTQGVSFTTQAHKDSVGGQLSRVHPVAADVRGGQPMDASRTAKFLKDTVLPAAIRVAENSHMGSAPTTNYKKSTAGSFGNLQQPNEVLLHGTNEQQRNGHNIQQHQGGFSGKPVQGAYRGQSIQDGYVGKQQQGGYDGQPVQGVNIGQHQGGYNGQPAQGGNVGQQHQGGYNGQPVQGGNVGQHGYNGQPVQSGNVGQPQLGGYNGQPVQGGNVGQQHLGGYDGQPVQGGNVGQQQLGGYNGQPVQGGNVGHQQLGGYNGQHVQGGNVGQQQHHRGGYNGQSVQGGNVGHQQQGGFHGSQQVNIKSPQLLGGAGQSHNIGKSPQGDGSGHVKQPQFGNTDKNQQPRALGGDIGVPLYNHGGGSNTAGPQQGVQNGQPQQEGYKGQHQQGGYISQAQQGGYDGQQQQGGYNGQQQQGGYDGQQQQGGYNGQQQHGGYNGQQQQGGYNGQQQHGGYNGQQQQGGYDSQQQHGGYNGQQQQWGYDGKHQQGGYNGQQQLGGFNGQQQQGGYNTQQQNNRYNDQQQQFNDGVKATNFQQSNNQGWNQGLLTGNHGSGGEAWQDEWAGQGDTEWSAGHAYNQQSNEVGTGQGWGSSNTQDWGESNGQSSSTTTGWGQSFSNEIKEHLNEDWLQSHGSNQPNNGHMWIQSTASHQGQSWDQSNNSKNTQGQGWDQSSGNNQNHPPRPRWKRRRVSLLEILAQAKLRLLKSLHSKVMGHSHH